MCSKRFLRKTFLSILLVTAILLGSFSSALTVYAVEASGDVLAELGAADFEQSSEIKKEDYNGSYIEDTASVVLESLNAADCMISKYVNAEEFNKASHVERLEHEEALDTYVFLNSDGSKSVYYMDENVKFIDESGNIKEKDISLVSKTDGYGIVRNEFDLHIPTSAVSGISMSYNGYDVRVTPQSTAKTVSARKVDGSVVYDRFFGTNTSLVYTPILSGIKEDVIMQAYIPNAEFSFVLDTDGLGLYHNDEGYYLAESEFSKTVLNLGRVIVYDAVGKPDYGTMNVITVTAKQKYILTLSAPEEFLTDPTTVYPVTIDPTLTVSDTATGDGAIEDAVLFSNRPSKNYGDYKYLSIGYVDTTYGVGRVAVKLQGLYNSVEYQNTAPANITSLKFYCWDSSGNSAQYVNLYPITGSTWNENTVTYSDSLSYTTTYNWGSTMSSGAWTAFDITSLAKAWKNLAFAQSKGFILVNSNETSASYKKAPYSAEHTTTSYRPYAVLTYSLPSAFPLNSYCLNNSLFGHYLTYNASLLSHSSGLINNLGTTACWELKAVGGGYLIRSKQNQTKCIVVADGTLPYVGMTTVNDTDNPPSSCIWEIVHLASDRYLIKSVHNSRYLYITDDANNYLYTSASTGQIGTDAYEKYVWRISSYNDVASNQLLDFNLDVSTLKYGEIVYANIIATPNNALWQGLYNDYTITLTQGSNRLNYSKDNGIRLQGLAVGSATLQITHKVTGLSKTFNIQVNINEIAIGAHTDNYGMSSTPSILGHIICSCGDRGSSICAEAFYDVINNYYEDNTNVDITPTSRMNGLVFDGACKDDLEELADDVDLMFFIGHGIAADRESYVGDRYKGNFLHYSFSSAGEQHDGSCYNPDLNYYTSEARFGGPNSRLKWFLAYSCNFLHTSEYVTEQDLKNMMQGARIVMGYSTRCTLYYETMEHMATSLTNGQTIIQAFFSAGESKEASVSDETHTQVAYYVGGAYFDTLLDINESGSETIYKVTNTFEGLLDDE